MGTAGKRDFGERGDGGSVVGIGPRVARFVGVRLVGWLGSSVEAE